MSEPLQASTPTANPPPTAPAAGLPLDMTQLVATYANYFHASVSAREVIVDFGLNSGLRTASGPEPVHVRQRIILPWQTARELLAFLQAITQQREVPGRGGARPSAPPAREETLPTGGTHGSSE